LAHANLEAEGVAVKYGGTGWKGINGIVPLSARLLPETQRSNLSRDGMDATVIGQTIISGILTGGLYALVAIGLTMIFGVLKIINFAHGEFLMLGMYLSFFLTTGLKLDPYFSVLFAIPIFFLIGIVIQKGLIDRVVRSSHDIQILLTLGLSLFLQNLALFIWGPHLKSMQSMYLLKVFRIGTLNINSTRLIAFVFALAMTGVLYIFLKRSDIGKAIRACSEERRGAQVVGINIQKMYLLAFGIGSACAGVAGTLLMPFYYVDPHVGMGFVLVTFVVVILGGMGSFIGALIGGFIIGIAEAFGAIILPAALKQVVTFVIFVLILFFKPTGLFGK
jgi:branched-chain amino acid transport system permease protein